MSVLNIKKKLPVRLFATNYIGGVGFYLFHAAWLLIVLLLLLQALRYVVLDGQLVPNVPTTSSATPGRAAMVSLPVFVSYAFSLLAVVASLLLLAWLPYFVGIMSRVIPRWLIRQTNRQLSAKNLHRTKQLLILFVACLSILALYNPSAEAIQNLAFFLVLALCLAASVCFWVQYKTAAHWKIPVSSLF